MIEMILFKNCICEITQCLKANISESAINNFIVVVIALLIPIVIFIMGKPDYYSFDKKIVINKVFYYKYLIPVVLITSIFSFFPSLIILTILAILCLIILSCLVLISSYKWLRSDSKINDKLTYRQAMRVEYLKNIKSQEELIEVWNSIFYDVEFLEKNQTGIIEMVIESVQKYEDDFIKNPILDKNREFIPYLLSILCNNFNKINFSDINVFTKLVDYSLSYFTIESHKKIYLDSQKTIFEKLFVYSLNRKSYLYFLFDHVNKFAQNKTSEFYQDFFYDMFILLQKNGFDKYKDLWEVPFLKGHTITEQSITSDKAEFINAIFDGYFIFIDRELGSSNPDKMSIEGITKNLFPNINMIVWFDLLTFYYFNNFETDENEVFLHGRLRAWTIKERSFGHASPVNGGKETIYLLKKKIQWLNDNTQIQKEINMIEQIEKEKLFEEKSKEYMRMNSLKNEFKVFLESNKLITKKKRPDSKSKKKTNLPTKQPQ